MPAYCDPWPVNRNATFGELTSFARPALTPADFVPSRSASSRSRNSPASRAVRTARWLKCERPTLAE